MITLLSGVVVTVAAVIVALPVEPHSDGESPAEVAAAAAAGTNGAEETHPQHPAVGSHSASSASATGGRHREPVAAPAPVDSPPAAKRAAADADAEKVISLFDGKTLNGWKSTEFGGEGDTVARDGQLILETGIDLTGVTSTRTDLPRENYEINLDAMRVNGSDFFCGLTFPVGLDYCSLIIGGWGGGVVGISSLDDQDASENETTLYRELKNKKWYHIRLKVTSTMIEAWLDDEQIVDVERAGRKISTRSEVDLSQPLGLASWQTTAALKNIQLRLLPEPPKANPDTPAEAGREAETD